MYSSYQAEPHQSGDDFDTVRYVQEDSNHFENFQKFFDIQVMYQEEQEIKQFFC